MDRGQVTLAYTSATIIGARACKRDWLRKMIEDPGEIAQLASEYISSLDNVPQEVQHIIREIEHKDAKVQELLPKMAQRESHLREIIGRRDAVLNDSEKIKVEKLTEKITADYARADEWNAQKERLSRDLWRNLTAHVKRLEVELQKINPVLVQQAESALSGTLATQASLLPPSSSISSAVLGALRSPSVEASLDFGSSPSGVKRKLGAGVLPIGKAARHSAGHDRHGISPSPLSGKAFSPAPTSKKTKHALSIMTKAPQVSSIDADIDYDEEADAAEAAAALGGSVGSGEEKDDRTYCFCNRVSFGEMIGCDNDDCPYEWFHLSCVGLSKPLPAEWYCSACVESMRKEKEAQTAAAEAEAEAAAATSKDARNANNKKRKKNQLSKG